MSLARVALWLVLAASSLAACTRSSSESSPAPQVSQGPSSPDLPRRIGEFMLAEVQSNPNGPQGVYAGMPRHAGPRTVNFMVSESAFQMADCRPDAHTEARRENFGGTIDACVWITRSADDESVMIAWRRGAKVGTLIEHYGRDGFREDKLVDAKTAAYAAMIWMGSTRR